MIILEKDRIELPDNSTYEDIEDAKITADRKGWKQSYVHSHEERMKHTDLTNKCGSCKYFIPVHTLNAKACGDCAKGRVGFRQRTIPACKEYERVDK